jgi:hypothetical protein
MSLVVIRSLIVREPVGSWQLAVGNNKDKRKKKKYKIKNLEIPRKSG